MKKSELKQYIKEIILAELDIKAKPNELKNLQPKPGDKIEITTESEEEPSEAEIRKEKSFTALQKKTEKIKKLKKEMADKAKEYKKANIEIEDIQNRLQKAKSDSEKKAAQDNLEKAKNKKQEFLNQLRDLTGEKNKLETEVNRSKTDLIKIDDE